MNLITYQMPVSGPGRGDRRADNLSDSPNLNGCHSGVLCPGVACQPEDGHVSKTGCSELFQEGISFLSAGDSGKPVDFAGSYLGGERLTQDELSEKDSAAVFYHTREFRKDRRSRRIEVEDAVDKCCVNRPIFQRQVLRVSPAKEDILQAKLLNRLVSAEQHGFAEVQPEHSPARSDALRCYQ